MACRMCAATPGATQHSNCWRSCAGSRACEAYRTRRWITALDTVTPPHDDAAALAQISTLQMGNNTHPHRYGNSNRPADDPDAHKYAPIGESGLVAV